MIEERNKEQNIENTPKIHVQTFDFGPHKRKVIFLPKDNPERVYATWVWVVASIIIGISVASTVYGAGEKMASFILDKKIESPQIASAEDNKINVNIVASATEENMGSDDKNIVDPSAPVVDGQYYFQREDYRLPRTSALAYLAADIDTGEIIIEKNPKMVLPIASVSKLVTALVSKDVLNQRKPITVSRSSIDTYGTMGGLNTGEKILVTDLLYPLLIESSNDAAEVLAGAYGRKEFVAKMNAKVKELEMPDTAFGDPSGLSPENVSNSRDLFTLAKHIDKDHPELWDITRIRDFAILKHNWVNANALSRRLSFIGGKNGYTTEAARTTVSVFEIGIEKQKRKIVIVILKSNDREGDVDAIIRFLEREVGFLPNENKITPSN